MTGKGKFKVRAGRSEADIFTTKPDWKEWAGRIVSGLFLAGFAGCGVLLYDVQTAIRNKKYCHAAEHDAYAIAAAFTDYFALPGHTALGPVPISVGPGRSTRNGIQFGKGVYNLNL